MIKEEIETPRTQARKSNTQNKLNLAFNQQMITGDENETNDKGYKKLKSQSIRDKIEIKPVGEFTTSEASR